MSLRNFVKQNVAAAFNLIGDLKTEATLTSEGVSGYNPLTSKVETTGHKTVTAFGVIMTEDNKLTHNNDVESDLMRVMFNRDDIPEGFSTFDSITIQGRSHRVVYFKDDGYTVTYTVSVR